MRSTDELNKNKYYTLSYWILRTIAASGGIFALFLLLFAVFWSDGLYYYLCCIGVAFVLLIPYRLTIRPVLFFPRLILIVGISGFAIERAVSQSTQYLKILSIYTMLFAIAAPLALFFKRYLKFVSTKSERDIGILIGIIIIAVLISLDTCQTIRDADYYVRTLGYDLECDLGFDYESPYYRIGDRFEEVFELHVSTYGSLYEAGVRDGDIPLGYSITGFYRMLYNNRGKEVTFYVVPGGDGPPLNKRPKKEITIDVPRKD